MKRYELKSDGVQYYIGDADPNTDETTYVEWSPELSALVEAAKNYADCGAPITSFDALSRDLARAALAFGARHG